MTILANISSGPWPYSNAKVGSTDKLVVVVVVVVVVQQFV